jgi:Fic family protein
VILPIIASPFEAIMTAKHLKRWIWQQDGWPGLRWDAAALAAPLAAARRAQGEVAGMARLLDDDAELEAQVEVLTREGVATSAIEGESVDPGAVRSSLARRLGLPTAGLPHAPRHVEGLVDVMLEATREPAAPLTLERLCAWQAALFPTGRSGLHQIRVGELRGDAPMQIVSGAIGHERVHYEAPPRGRLDAEMKRFLAWFNQPPAELDGLLRAGVAHAWFELVHPFEDGNGRVGRALLDRALLQDEGHKRHLYSLSARIESQRDAYYDTLGELSRGGLDCTPWLRWFLLQVAAAAQTSEGTVRQVMRKARFWLTHAAKALNERQKKGLNAMLDAGPEGFTGGMTNKKYAHLAKTSPATAQRDLAQLVELGCLVLEGAGRGARYVLPPAAGSARQA